MIAEEFYPVKTAFLSALPALAIALAAPGSSRLAAQVSFTGAPYVQDFDSLPGAASGVVPFTFENNVTLPGWYFSEARPNNARASSGQRDGGLLYSWGSNKGADRALGIFFGASSGGYPTPAMLGLQLRNDSGATISTLRLSFDVEQWRSHGLPATWEFSRLVTESPDNRLAATSGYVSDLRGDVRSPHTGSGSGINGNLAENRRSLRLVLENLDWRPGHSLWLRWVGEQVAGASGIGLDNLRVEASGPASGK